MKTTKNQKGFQKMLKKNKKVPLFLGIGFDNIHANHLDRVRQIKFSKDLSQKRINNNLMR